MNVPESMPWLLPPPADFRTLIKQLRCSENPDVLSVLRLASTALDVSQSKIFGKLVKAARAPLETAGLQPVKLGLVGTHTLDYVADALPAAGVRHGLLLSIVVTDYGQVMQSVLDPHSSLHVAHPDMVLCSLDPASLGLAEAQLETDGAAAAIAGAIAYIRSLRDAIRERLGAVAVLQTLPLPADPLFGAFDACIAGSPRAMVEAFNRALVAEILEPGDLLVDAAFVAASFGLAKWHDARGWHSAKLPFSLDATPLHADNVCRVLAAAKGKARKCLVLDLDNTLWGGVIGDDGVEGIVLGQGSASGEAYLAIHRLALALRQRGVILAVCSKNEDAAAKLPFREHAETLLKEVHFAAFIANWSDKATNLRTIAATLNIGTDALVFLDDNPAERAIIRAELPEVAVPEVGDDPSLYPAMIARAGYFDAVAFSQDDRVRADYYHDNALRASALGATTDMASYLASLEMRMTISPFDAAGRSRVAQLINKSNQFNLTTRRYTEQQVAEIEDDPARFAVQIRLADRFGDNGMISVVVFDRGSAAWTCDTWLMSCRVLGRRVEEAVLRHVAEAAQRAGATRLVGSYLPSPKNMIVEHHFEKLGFSALDRHPDGQTDWVLLLDRYVAPELPLDVKVTASSG